MDAAPYVHTVGKKQHVIKLFPSTASLRQLTEAIIRAVGRSFEGSGHMRSPTRAELKRRFDICMKWAIQLRGDLKWGVQRISDAMPEILRTELSGRNWVPQERLCWIPSDGE